MNSISHDHKNSLAVSLLLCHGPARRAQYGQVFAFDAVSYFLQAFAGEILLIFPIVYGFTNSAPFNTWNIEFALYFFPFIITGVLPTVAALGWQKTPSAKVGLVERMKPVTAVVFNVHSRNPVNVGESKSSFVCLHLCFERCANKDGRLVPSNYSNTLTRCLQLIMLLSSEPMFT